MRSRSDWLRTGGTVALAVSLIAGVAYGSSKLGIGLISGTSCGYGYGYGYGCSAQTLSFTTAAPSNAAVGTSYEPAARSTSGLAPVISLDASSTGCTLSGGTVSFRGAGTCVLDANQAGEANYKPAAQVQQSFSVRTAN